MLTVALVSTGHEVLRGHTVNTNAAWLGLRATQAGARVVRAVTVGDDVVDIERAIREASGAAAWVVVTGGLGPTEDDRSREGLAKAAGVSLAHDERAWAVVERYFRRALREPLPMQRRQALLPAGSEVLDNTEGTAPGCVLPVGGVPVALLPGPPREMRSMFEKEILPRWRASGFLEDVVSRVVWTAGVPESEVAAPIEAQMRADEPVVGTHPDDGEVAVRILARGLGAKERAQAVVDAVLRAFPDQVVSMSDEERVQHALVRDLARRGCVMTTAESVTGGLVARMLCEVPGASDVFRGGWVTYSDAWKARELGVGPDLLAREGAVSAAVAAAMVEGALEKSGADVAVSTTGVAGPGPDGRGVPEGTVFVAGIRRGLPVRILELHLVAPRLALQRRAAVLALDLARRLVAHA